MHEPHEPRVVPGIHCEHLEHKAMYVMSVPNPSVLRFYDKYDGTAYWCAQTCSAFGPDGHPVRPDCCGDHRGCCSH